MKRTVFSIAAGLAVAMLALAPMSANAQPRTRGTAPDQTTVNDTVSRLLRENSMTCQFEEARWVGRNGDRTLYEVACLNENGFLMIDSAPPQVVECIANNASVAARRAEDPEADVGSECTIASNIDILGIVRPIVQRASLTCEVDEARWVGATSGGQTRYEIGCANADGYWIDVATDGTPSSVLPCLQVVGAGQSCQFTSAQEQAAWVAALAQPSGRACQPTGARYVGANTEAGTRYYEVGCSEGAGFMVRTDTGNAFQAVIECAAATGIAGGCTLSDTGTVAASANAEYQRRLGEAGITCAFQSAGTPRSETEGDRRTVIEFDCSDRPWGLVAFLPNGAGSAEQIDCLTGEARIGGCTLTPRADLIEELSLLMSRRSNSPCSVEDFRFAGRLTEADGAEFTGDVVELKCSQGTGYISVVNAERTEVVQAQTCTVSAQRGGTRCELN